MCSIGGAVGLAKIFIKNYYAYLGVEFLESVLASGLYTVAVVLRKLKLNFIIAHRFSVALLDALDSKCSLDNSTV